MVRDRHIRVVPYWIVDMLRRLRSCLKEGRIPKFSLKTSLIQQWMRTWLQSSGTVLGTFVVIRPTAVISGVGYRSVWFVSSLGLAFVQLSMSFRRLDYMSSCKSRMSLKYLSENSKHTVFPSQMNEPSDARMSPRASLHRFWLACTWKCTIHSTRRSRFVTEKRRSHLQPSHVIISSMDIDWRDSFQHPLILLTPFLFLQSTCVVESYFRYFGT